MRYQKFTLFILILLSLISCGKSEFSDKNIYNKAKNIIEIVDANNINTFYEWGFGQRGKFDLFTKFSISKNENRESYNCFFFKDNDSAQILVFQFDDFKKDFPTNLKIDTSKYYRTILTKFPDSVICVSAIDKQGEIQIVNKNIPLQELFQSQNPFLKLQQLSEFKNRLGIIGTFHRPDIGNFIEFYLSSQHILTYLPENLYLNPAFKIVWLNEFSKGETIKKNWILRKLDEPMDSE